MPPLVDFNELPDGLMSGITNRQYCEIAQLQHQSRYEATTSEPNSEPNYNETLAQLNCDAESSNTKKRNKWAARLFQDWKLRKHPDNNQPLFEMADDELNAFVPFFIHDVRKSNGERYPGPSLVSIAAGLQASINIARQDQNPVNFFKSERFIRITRSLDASMKLSTKSGCGLLRKSAEVISYHEEEKLWVNCFGDDCPKKLLRSLFYLNGIHFALRGGIEHSNLDINQLNIEIREGKKCLVYTEKNTKTNAGGLRHQRYSAKQVVHFENVENKKRDHVALFVKFLTVRPANCSRFYLQAVKNIKPSQPWYTSRPIGKNILAKIMQTCSEEAGISGQKTNHSLRATCATRLYQGNYDQYFSLK